MVRRFLMAVTVGGMLALPATAGAATFFAAQSGSGNACTEASPCALAQALTNADAAADRDTITVLGALTTSSPVDLSNSPIDLVGSGRDGGGTLIDSASAPALRVGRDSSAAALGVHSTGAGPAAVVKAGGDLTGVAISDTATGANAISIDPLGGGGETVIADSQLAGAASGSAPGLTGTALAGSLVRLVDSTIAGAAGTSFSGTLIVQRSTVIADGTGLSQLAGALSASSSVVSAATGVDVSGATADLRQLTVAARGAAANGVRAGSGASISLAGSIVRDFTTDLAQTGSGALRVGTSDFASAGAGVDTTGGGNRDFDPQFRDPLGLNFRLRYSSPAIDAAAQPVAGPEESPYDRDGHARALDGNDDGTAERDMGAYEYRRPSAVLSFTGSAQTGEPLTFSAGASAYPDGEIGGYRWDLDGDGLFETDTGPLPQAQHTYAVPGRVTVRLRVVGLDGASDDAARTLTVVDRIRPVVLSAAAVPSVFAVDRRATPVSARARRGTVIRYRLSEPASVRIVFERQEIGRRVGRRCLPATRARRHRPRCIRYIASGSLSRRNRPAGQSDTPFTGRVGSRPLSLGRYRGTITATDAGRNRSLPKRFYFRVVLR